MATTFDFSRTPADEAPVVTLDPARDEADARVLRAWFAERDDVSPSADAQLAVGQSPARPRRRPGERPERAQEAAYADPTPDEYADQLGSRGHRVIRQTGGRYMAQCPCHEDRTPSLSIAPGRDKPLILKCHGCHASFSDLLAAAGFKPRRNQLLSYPYVSSLLGSCPSPCPSVYSDGGEQNWRRPELYQLLEDHAAGLIEPVDVGLGELPKRAGQDARRVAEDLALLLGLRYADGERRPVPYSVRFCAQRMGWDDHARASVALRNLERWGVVSVTVLPRREGVCVPYGTKAYGPPSGDLAACPTLRANGGAEVDSVAKVMLEPAPEVTEELGVDDAVVLVGGREVGMVTTGDTALPDDVVPTSTVEADKLLIAQGGSPFVVASADDGSRSYRPMCRCVYNRQGLDDDGRCQGCGGVR